MTVMITMMMMLMQLSAFLKVNLCDVCLALVGSRRGKK